MKMDVGLGDLCNILAGQDRPESFRRLLQLFHHVIRHPVACQLNGQLFQRPSHFQHVPKAFLCNLCYFRPFSWYHKDQPFQLKLADRLSDRGTAHPKLICQLDLHKPLPRLQLPL